VNLARIVAVSVLALGVLTLVTIRLVASRAARRRIARSVALAAGIADERRGPWLFAEDTTPDEDEPTEVLAMDPPVVRGYTQVALGPGDVPPPLPIRAVPPLATPASVEPLTVVSAPPAAGLDITGYPSPYVPVGAAMVHRSCAAARRDGQPERICAVCRPRLAGGSS
jgi:hypothetical protein